MNTNIYRNQEGQFVIRTADSTDPAICSEDLVFANFPVNFALDVAFLVQAVYCRDLEVDEVLSALVIAPCASALPIEPARS